MPFARPLLYLYGINFLLDAMRRREQSRIPLAASPSLFIIIFIPNTMCETGEETEEDSVVFYSLLSSSLLVFK
jgi:hypothetical protein